MPAYHLAQFNIARMLAPLDSPTMAGFVGALEEVNALADAAPGFIWRLQTEDGDATAFRPYGDDAVIVTMSVWQDAASLHAYVYNGGHADALRQRRQWFARLTDAAVVLWWVPAGHHPTVAEGVARLEALRRDGPTGAAFSFRTLFPAPSETLGVISDPPESLPATCPADE